MSIGHENKTLRKIKDNDEIMLELLDHNHPIFRMPIKYDLVFATPNYPLGKLWVLESGGPNNTDISSEIDLATGHAVTYHLEKGKRKRKTEWRYDRNQDSWEFIS